MAQAASAEDQPPLVRATAAQLREVRLRVASVAEESMARKEPPGKGGGRGAAAAPASAPVPQQDPTTISYARAFQAAVASKVGAMCEPPSPRESREEDELFGDVVRFCDEVQAARVRLAATRARVAGLSAATCNDAIRISEAADDRACCVLNASTEHARKEAETGGPLPLVSAANGGDNGDTGDSGDGHRVSSSFTGIDAAILEPKIGALIGKLSELPGPLKSVLQEIPELTASLAVSVQNAESVVESRESRTEALLGKAPPTPLPRKGKAAAAAAGRGGGAGADGEPDDERHPPEEVRSAARGARMQQAKKDWESEGVGMVGGFFN